MASKRRKMILVVAVGMAATAGCGGPGTATFEDKPRPPTPVNVTVYINDNRLSVSPHSVGAGPVDFEVTNKSSNSESITIVPAGNQSSQPLAKTGPISPQATAGISVNLQTPGDYTVATAPQGSNEATLATPSSIAPDTLHVGAKRGSGYNQLLEP